MTSIAFIFSVPCRWRFRAVPAPTAAIGTGVMGGMITATVLAVFLVPVFFVVVRRIFPGHARHHGDSGHGRKRLLHCSCCWLGCSLAPDYRRPAAPIPGTWPDATDATGGDGQEAGS